jgi:hypothetical protein
MTIESRMEHAGIDVHFEPDECELFARLAADAEKLGQGGIDTPAPFGDIAPSYFSLSLALGQRIRAITQSRTTAA